MAEILISYNLVIFLACYRHKFLNNLKSDMPTMFPRLMQHHINQSTQQQLGNFSCISPKMAEILISHNLLTFLACLRHKFVNNLKSCMPTMFPRLVQHQLNPSNQQDLDNVSCICPKWLKSKYLIIYSHFSLSWCSISSTQATNSFLTMSAVTA